MKQLFSEINKVYLLYFGVSYRVIFAVFMLALMALLCGAMTANVAGMF